VVLDLDGDGALDIVFTVWRGDDCVCALSGRSGKPLWKFKTGGSMYHGVTAGDLDNDGKPEVVVCSTDGSLYLLKAATGKQKWSKKFTRHQAFAPVSLGDLDGDGKLEIVVTVRGVQVFRHDGKVIWKKDLPCSIARGAALVDLDGDGKLEIIFGGGDKKLRVWRGTDGSELASFDATCGKHPYEGINHAPVIADFNGDGASDIFFVAGKGTSDKTRPQNYGCAYALSFGKGKGEWKTFRHDNQRSGCTAGPFRKK
jgi:outer membrane protein assembly factor BamB